MWGECERPDWPCLGSGSSKEGPGSLTAALDKPGFPLVTRLAAGWTQWRRGEGRCRGAGISAALVPPPHTHTRFPRSWKSLIQPSTHTPPQGCCVPSGWGSGERGITAAVGAKSPWPWFCGKYPPRPPGVALRPQWALGGWAKAGDRLGAEQGCVLQSPRLEPQSLRVLVCRMPSFEAAFREKQGPLWAQGPAP